MDDPMMALFEESISPRLTYKAISLWQPWASLLIDGRKKIETRHWPAPKWLIGQEMAIHAAKKCEKEFAEECGYSGLPGGAILGIAKLRKCERFTEEFYKNIQLIEEAKYGDFYPGRFGWFFEVTEKFAQPVMQRGAQGIFDWMRP